LCALTARVLPGRAGVKRIKISINYRGALYIQERMGIRERQESTVSGNLTGMCLEAWK